MPALTSYSPYETLVFFQNVAKYGADASALQDISVTLNENQLIREGKSYDANRFSPAALQALYEKVIRTQPTSNGSSVNGDIEDASENPRKRKLSASPPPPHGNQQRDEQELLNGLVDRLYARFREEAIKEIRRSEQEYQKLLNEVHQLEEQPNASPPQTQDKVNETGPDNSTLGMANGVMHDQAGAQVQPDSDSSRQKQPSGSQEKLSPSSAQDPSLAYPKAPTSPGPGSGANTPRSATATPQARLPSATQLSSQSSQPFASNTNNGNVSIPPSQRSNFVPVPSQHGYPSSPQTQNLHAQSMSPMPPPSEYAGLKKAQSQGRVSPSHHLGQPSYPGYPPYPPPQPQWQSPVPLQPYAHPTYPGQQFYPQQPGRPGPGYHTPNQPMYPPYPQTAPVPYPNQQQWRGVVPQPYQSHPASASTTPVPRAGRRSSLLQSGGSTPWKKKSSAVSTPVRGPPSPSRNEREMSPWSDRGSPPPETGIKQQSSNEQDASLLRGRRAPSMTPSARAMSRAQSVVSHTSETASEKPGSTRRGKWIKIEAPSTPLPISDNEQPKSTGRRGRPRNNTATSRPEMPKVVNVGKRKHESITSPTPSPAGHSPALTQQTPTAARRIPCPNDQSLVVVSKNFSKPSQLLLNEITSHKLAGIFAKPLSERDAPGYRDLIFRPQDLKSIKAAISKGSRLAATAIEELESSLNVEVDDPNVTSSGVFSDGEDISTPKFTGNDGVSVSASLKTEGERSIGNGFYFIRKTEELTPPKGIVNSAQLEMELIRMFANAVMFNPLPRSERGFGRSLRLRKNGGDVVVRKAGDDEEETESSENSSSSEEDGDAADEDGIIADAREMFEDVVLLASRWRDLEGERMAGPSTTTSAQAEISSNRHVSVSGSAHEQEDEEHQEQDGSETTPAVVAVGTARKRRRVGER